MGSETLGATIAPKNRPKLNNAPYKEPIDDYLEIKIEKIIKLSLYHISTACTSNNNRSVFFKFLHHFDDFLLSSLNI